MPFPDPPRAAGRPLVFLHIPKTGGTTLHHHFSQAFAPEEICPERFSNLAAIPAEEMRRYRYFSGHYNFGELRCIPGRPFIVTVLRDPVERILSTYYFWKRHRAEVVAAGDLRGPAAARAHDLLGFLRCREPEVTDALDNTMARYLAGKVNVAADGSYRFRAAGTGVRISELEIMHRAMGNLLATDVLGFTTDLAEVYARVAIAFGMPQIERLERLNTRDDADPKLEPVAEEALTPEVRAELRRLTAMDRELVWLARQHRRAARR